MALITVSGPSKWPGCSKIEIGGRLVSLLGKPAAERIALANRLLTMDIASAEQGILADQAPVVYRHLVRAAAGCLLYVHYEYFLRG